MRATLKKFVRVAMMAAALTAGMIGASCSNNGDKDTTPTDKYGTPYDRAIGNGNYILHNFMSDNDNIKLVTVVDDANHYLELGETYLNGLADDFSKSLNNRPTAKNYFNSIISAIKDNDYFHVTSNKTNNMDVAMNIISLAVTPVLTDILKNVKTEGERDAFYYGYRVLRNEAYKEGLGKSRQGTSSNNTLLEPYDEEKEALTALDSYDDVKQPAANINFTKAYQTNDFTAITDMVDDMLTIAANNMKTKQNIDVTTADLRSVVNFGLDFHTLRGMHNHMAFLSHNCTLLPERDVETMNNTLRDLWREEQLQAQQNQELGM